MRRAKKKHNAIAVGTAIHQAIAAGMPSQQAIGTSAAAAQSTFEYLEAREFALIAEQRKSVKNLVHLCMAEGEGSDIIVWLACAPSYEAFYFNDVDEVFAPAPVTCLLCLSFDGTRRSLFDRQFKVMNANQPIA